MIIFFRIEVHFLYCFINNSAIQWICQKMKSNNKIDFLFVLWTIHLFFDKNLDRHYLTDILPIRLGDYSTINEPWLHFTPFLPLSHPSRQLPLMWWHCSPCIHFPQFSVHFKPYVLFWHSVNYICFIPYNLICSIILFSFVLCINCFY